MALTPESVRAAATNRRGRTSILDQRRPATEMTRANFLFKALLLGASGGGKSSSALTIPGQKLVIDLEGRAASLAGIPDVDIIAITEPDSDKPSALDDLIRLKDELWTLARSPEGLPYNLIVFDGITRLSRYAMNMAMQLRTSDNKLLARGPGETPSQPHYRPLMEASEKLIFQMLPLPCHIVFTGHIEMHEDKKLKTFDYYPKITGKTRTEVSSWFNETIHCYRAKGKYFWGTAPTLRYPWLKSAANQGGRYWKDDLEIDLEASPTGFEEILNLRFGATPTVPKGGDQPTP